MRLVVTSDWHADWSTLGVRRHAEVRAAAEAVVEDAVARGADAFLFLGDLADPDSGGDTFRAVRLAQECAIRLAAAGIPSVWLAGNHDVCEDGSGGSALEPLKALEEQLYAGPTGEERLVHVATAARVVWLSSDVAVLCLPFSPASHGYDAAMMASSLWPSRPLPRPDGPLREGERARVVAAGHLMIPGVHPGSETEDMPRGREVLFPFEATRGAVLRLNGHYHRRQAFDPGDGGPPVLIPGSVARLTFGEQDHRPGYLRLEVPGAP